MSKEKVELMVEGGKATPGPQLAQKIGPLGMNMGNILNSINDKTSHFRGMKIPVKVIIDTKSKQYDLEIGTPPISELIKKELNLEKGSAMPDKEKIGNLAIEQVIKIALMKKDSMLVNSLKAAVKNVVGSCNSIGVLVEGKIAIEINEAIDSGIYDKQINSQSTEITEEKKAQLKEQLEEVNQEIKKELEREKALVEKLEEKKEVKEEEVVAKEEVPGKLPTKPESMKEEVVEKPPKEVKESKKEVKK